MITLFVGDNGEYLSDAARAHDPTAFLVDFSNWKKIVNSGPDQNITIYTSLSDLPKIDAHISVLWDLIRITTKIFYLPPEQWSDDQRKFSWSGQKTLTEYYLYQAQLHGKDVIGLNLLQNQKSSYLKLIDQRKTNEACLWMVGCSITHGVGVTNSERYGYILGQMLEKPTHHLTMPGSSLEWQADQILRSDIKKGDIVVWGLTQEKRAPMAKNGVIISWPDDTIEDVDYRLHETRYYKAITSIYQVINFCHKIEARLFLLPLICSEKLQIDLKNEIDYYQFPYQIKYLDRGSDKQHPGPNQHAEYAKFCYSIISKW